MKNLSLSLLFTITLFTFSYAQNLVKNPSFENNAGCPMGTSQFNLVSDWTEPNTATTDYYHSCSPLGGFGAGVPSNLIGTQPAHSGNAYAGIVVFDGAILFGNPVPGSDRWREYIQGELTSPMIAGQNYCVEFYVSLSDTVAFAINEIGVAFSNTQINDPDSTVLPGITPALTFNSGLNNASSWVLMQGQYTATGGEQYIIIGNFNNSSNTSTVPTSAPNPSPLPPTGSYYYIDDVSVIQGACCTIDFSAVTKNDSCSSSAGEINLTVNGNSNYTFNWENTATNIATTEDVTGLAAGTYKVTITDVTANCTKDTTITITDNTANCCNISISAISKDDSCTTGIGEIDLTVNGSNTYSYNWVNTSTSANVGTTQDITGMQTGTYTVTVTDNVANCSKDTTITIGNNTNSCCFISVSATSTNESCGNANGSIDITVNTSNPNNFSYSWSSGQTTEDLANLSAGTYTLNITDNSTNPACTKDTTITITNSSGFTVDTTNHLISAATCGNNDGSITGITSSATGLTFSWIDASNNTVVGNTIDLNNVPSGVYIFSAVDANGCTFTSGPYIINNSNGPQINESGLVITQIGCGRPTGSISGLSVTGGTSPYNYVWVNSAGNTIGNTIDISNLPAETYVLQVTDANGCSTLSTPIQINQGSQLSINATITQLTCDGKLGSVSINTSGATGTVNYAWGSNTGNNTSSSISNLTAGTYCVSVTDGSSCQIDTCFTIASANGVNADFSLSDSVIILPTTSFSTDNNSTGSIIGVLWVVTNSQGIVVDSSTTYDGTYNLPNVHGNYYVKLIVSDGNCTDSLTKIINVQLEPEKIFIPNTFTPDGDSKNEVFVPIVNESIDEYHFQIFNRWGTILFDSKQTGEAWEGTHKGVKVMQGIYIWKLQYKGINSPERKTVIGHVGVLY